MLRASPLPCIRSQTQHQYRRWRHKGNSAVPLCRRSFASVIDRYQHLHPGEFIHGFSLKRIKDVPELQLKAIHLVHEKTGLEHLHVARDDRNNVFSIGFKTNPPDDTGVPHILEHTTLCGSEKYPVRDPFFKMLPRSLSNFMNAFTSSDHTTYPFATTNQKDFQNLMSVYLDATLRPLLNENDFIQEGWRVGPEDPLAGDNSQSNGSADSKLVFKGVVYNEMKGQMSDAGYLYYIKFQDHIFPDINNSGGDPQKMTDLTLENLRKFHSKCYKPSNAKLVTYGDMPLANHLEEINRQLDGFGKTTADKAIKLPIDLSNEPLYFHVKGPRDPMFDKDMQYKTSTSWLMGDSSNTLETFSLGIMSALLLDGYGSPLYQALIETGMGPDWSPNTGFDTAGKVGIFSVGLNGVRKEAVLRVKGAIEQKLCEVYNNGFDKSKVDGLLHQLELGLKHKTTNFGMGLAQRIQPGWFNGVDPFEVLAWNDVVSGFKQRFGETRYLESLLEKYLLNDRTLTFRMEPSDSYVEDLVTEEAGRLATKISEATRQAGGETAAYEKLVARELDLLEAQQRASNQDLSCLPTVHVTDVPRQMENKNVRDSSLGDVKVQWREASTNGLTYFRAINTFDGLPTELRMLIPLFTDSIMRLGTKGKSMEELEDLIKLKTGGIRASYHTSPSPLDMNLSTEGLSLSGYALDNNVPAMYSLLRTVLQETNFEGPDAERKIIQLVQADASGAMDAIASSGHSYARRYAEAGLSRHGLLNEQVAGLTQIQQTANLAHRSSTEGLSDIMEKLKAIQNFATSKSSKFRVALNCSQEATSVNESALEKFLSHLSPSSDIPSGKHSTTEGTFNKYTFFPLPYQVYYSALAIPTVPYIHPSGAPLQVLSQLLTHKHLHHEIREKGGAYGGGAYASDLSGLFGYYSYRDPNPRNSMNIMRDAGQWARDKDWSDQDLEEAKLSIFQGVDAPESVSEEGMTRFLSGVDAAMEQTKREQLLDVKKEDVRLAAQQYLVERMKGYKLAVLGEQKTWANKDENWEVKRMDLGKPSEAGSTDTLSDSMSAHI